MKKIFANRSNKILLALFLLTMVMYIIILATAFAELPISVEPVHLRLLMFFHFIPMFFLEILLCKLTRPFWRMIVPIILLTVPVLIFVAAAEFYALAWYLAGLWIVAPAMGSLLGGLIWHIHHWLKKKFQ